MDQTKIPFGFIEEDNVFLKGWNEHPDRKIGVVKNNNHDISIEYFTARFTKLVETINELKEKVDSAENKGSFLVKLVHLKDSLSTYDGLGDFAELHVDLSKVIEDIQNTIEANRSKNAEIKEALLEETKAAIDLVNWHEATEKLHDVKNRWLKTGKATTDELDEQFWAIMQDFFDRKKAFYDDKAKLAKHYERKYETIIEAAEKLQPGTAEFSSKVQALKNEWKENGGVPQEVYKDLLNRFHRAIKPKNQFSSGPNPLKEIIERLEKVDENSPNLTRTDIGGIIKSLSSFKPRTREDKELRRTAFDKINRIQEIGFMLSLCRKRSKQFDQVDQAEQRRIKTKVLLELIKRDREELALYESNEDNIKSQNEKFINMMKKRLDQQKRKILLKEQLLSELKAQG